MMAMEKIINLEEIRNRRSAAQLQAFTLLNDADMRKHFYEHLHNMGNSFVDSLYALEVTLKREADEKELDKETKTELDTALGMLVEDIAQINNLIKSSFTTLKYVDLINEEVKKK
jgi:RNA polymerase-interacting CarD/CdnL/TRCF family regulator